MMKSNRAWPLEYFLVVVVDIVVSLVVVGLTIAPVNRATVYEKMSPREFFETEKQFFIVQVGGKI